MQFPTDSKGQPLAPGDIVMIQFLVTRIRWTEVDTNMDLQSIVPLVTGGNKTDLTALTGLTEKVNARA